MVHMLDRRTALYQHHNCMFNGHRVRGSMDGPSCHGRGCAGGYEAIGWHSRVPTGAGRIGPMYVHFCSPSLSLDVACLFVCVRVRACVHVFMCCTCAAAEPLFDFIDFVMPPTLSRVSGCTDNLNVTEDCPTAGGVTLTLFGTNLFKARHSLFLTFLAPVIFVERRFVLRVAYSRVHRRSVV